MNWLKRKTTIFKVILSGIAFISFFQAPAQELKVSFTTSNIVGAKYSPKHVLAVWIKDSNNKYVKTLMVYASERKKDLVKWNASSAGDRTDAVTGATQSSHQTRTVSWNLKNIAGQMVTNGNYKLCMEITSADVAGPYREIDFTLNGSDFTLKPENASNFNAITMVFENGVAAKPEQPLEQDFVKIYPSFFGNHLHAEIKMPGESEGLFTLYSSNMQEIGSIKTQLHSGLNRVTLDDLLAHLPRGNYFLVTQTTFFTISNQLYRK